uniref:Uncharacterized protein n=1 Tax=Arundo donax TaxID=35708 RepID=A0A0A9B2I8_ARUDO
MPCANLRDKSDHFLKQSNYKFQIK